MTVVGDKASGHLDGSEAGKAPATLQQPAASSQHSRTEALTFSKQERIVSQKLIDELFGSRKNHALSAFPLKAVYISRLRTEPSLPAVQLLISVPKRCFKHAVDRNRVKRQVREAYRRQKSMLTPFVDDTRQIALAFIWLSSHHCPTDVVCKRVSDLLRRIKEKEKTSN